MKLEDIGFYTLSEERVKNASIEADLQRCELILTDRCNFKCPYCRGIRKDVSKELTYEEAKRIVDYWCDEHLHNIRLSGGEPTVWPRLVELVSYIKSRGVERIAISTNGYANLGLYESLIEAGVNDFSISLDACCSDYGDKMTGGIPGAFDKVISNIKEIAKRTYVSVGVVVTEETLDRLNETINFANSLGVADIRIIPSAQYDKTLTVASNIAKDITNTNPILDYRVNNIKAGKHVRGLKETDSRRCNLALDDMVIAGDYHFPCIIYMREQGDPIGKIGPNMRQYRKEWADHHDCYKDPICRKNCLDVCMEYNNKFIRYKIEQQTAIKRLDSSLFTSDIWSAGSVHDFGIEHFRFDNLSDNKDKLNNGLLGYCFGESLNCRPKENHIALMYDIQGKQFWFHIRNNEFYELFCKS